MKWDEETVQALKFIIRKTIANQAHGDPGPGPQSPNTSPHTGPGPTRITPPPLPQQQHPEKRQPNEDLRTMMQVPGSIRQFRVAARSVKHEVGDMIDILSRQEEEALHIAYDRGNINRIKMTVYRDMARAHDIDAGHIAADYTEDTGLPGKGDMVPVEVENINLLRAEAVSYTHLTLPTKRIV